MKTFCERLKELRLEKGLTHRELGSELGISGSIISRWENGLIVPTIISLYKIAVFFKVTTDYLLGLEN